MLTDAFALLALDNILRWLLSAGEFNGKGLGISHVL
jgi:hypothetical protein